MLGIKQLIMLNTGDSMKKIGLLCITALLGMSLAACGNSGSTKKSASSSSHSTSKVVKHHKHSGSQKKSSSNSESAASNQQAQTQSQSQNNVQTSQAAPNAGANNEEVYTAHPSQGGTIYQTNGNAGSFQGDPDTIAATQIKMQQAADRIANSQQ